MDKDKCRDLWAELCSYDNLFLAYKKARKHKTTKKYVLEFETGLENNLLTLRSELLLHCYKPKPLINFIIRDPKTRKISKSAFIDRIVHHALCNIIEPMFERSFIYDSYANRIGKGTLRAIKRFDFFKRKSSKNDTISSYILKMDIKKYFDNVDHRILLSILMEKITDSRTIWLIKKILNNYGSISKGMPLGNLTSQFFANVYLNKLDWFVKHKLKVKYYLRYVDDFVILDCNKEKLVNYKLQIDEFLKSKLNLQLHKDKSKIYHLGDSMTFLGFRVFYYHKLLKKSNLRRFKKTFHFFKEKYICQEIDYDSFYNFMEGWVAYAKNANTYRLRQKFLKDFEGKFNREISIKEINIYFKTIKKQFSQIKIPLNEQFG